MDRQELSCWFDLLEQAYRDHANWAVGPTATVLSEETPVQIEHLAGELRKRNQDFRDDYLDGDLKQRQQARLERYEKWTPKVGQRDNCSPGSSRQLGSGFVVRTVWRAPV